MCREILFIRTISQSFLCHSHSLKHEVPGLDESLAYLHIESAATEILDPFPLGVLNLPSLSSLHFDEYALRVAESVPVDNEEVGKSRSESHGPVVVFYLPALGVHSREIAVPSDDLPKALHFPQERDEHFLLVSFARSFVSH